MVSRGKFVFDRMLADSMVLVSEVKKTLPAWTCISESEQFLLAPSTAYRFKTGRELTNDLPEVGWEELRKKVANPDGSRFTDATICKLYPDLCTHFSIDWLPSS